MNQPLLDYFKKYLLNPKKHTPGSNTPGVKSANTPGVELTPSSIKNYVSDISLFLSWVSRTVQEETIHAQHITPAIIKTYEKYLSAKNPLTVKRHFSSLRRFGQFLADTNRLDKNPAGQLVDAPTAITLNQVLEKYSDYLRRENLSDSTIKNYLSDLNNYLTWDSQNCQKKGPTASQKGLSFLQKGRTLLGIFKKLTDNNLSTRSSN